jgi:hypothetical protein
MLKELAQTAIFGHGDKRRRAELFFRERLARGEREPFSEKIELTPELATLILESNPDNRKLSAFKVENYARDIASGLWAFNGEGLIFSRNGQLNDGQHRCHAVIKAGKSLVTMAVFGVDRETRNTVDQGKNRTVGDYLSMGHVKDASACAATAGLLWQFSKFGHVRYNSAYRPTPSELQEFFEANRSSIEESVSAITSKSSLLFGGRSFLAFCHVQIKNAAGYERATAFFSTLMTGENLHVRDPIYLARDRFLRFRRRPLEEKVEVVFRAWNMHVTGRAFGKIITNGALPKLDT